jgi:hypothetical protein
MFVGKWLNSFIPADSLDVKPVFKKTRKRKRNRLFYYEGEDESVFLDPKEKLRVEFFLITVDTVRNLCDERFALLRQYVNTWGFLFDITTVFVTRISGKFAELWRSL